MLPLDWSSERWQGRGLETGDQRVKSSENNPAPGATYKGPTLKLQFYKIQTLVNVKICCLPFAEFACSWISMVLNKGSYWIEELVNCSTTNGTIRIRTVQCTLYIYIVSQELKVSQSLSDWLSVPSAKKLFYFLHCKNQADVSPSLKFLLDKIWKLQFSVFLEWSL